MFMLIEHGAFKGKEVTVENISIILLFTFIFSGVYIHFLLKALVANKEVLNTLVPICITNILIASAGYFYWYSNAAKGVWLMMLILILIAQVIFAAISVPILSAANKPNKSKHSEL